MQNACPERSRRDAPAALPLIAYIAGWLFGRSWLDAAGFCVIALLLLAVRRARLAVACLALAGGVAAAAHAGHVARSEAAVVASFASDRFVIVGAPIDRDWMIRGSLFALRVSRFHVNGVSISKPLTFSARFAPPPIRLEERIVAEGFLRVNDRGELTLYVKSPRLMAYAGRMPWWWPATWNRALANRLRPYSSKYPTEIALVEALALGRGERLANEVRDGYKRAGTYHLLVFSGLQIAFAAGALAALLRWMHAPRASDWSLLMFAVVAPLFIGPSASVSRASIGIGLYAASRLLHRPTTLENLWCFAALSRLILAPADTGDAAFQLTYAGAGALMFIAKPLAARHLRWLTYAAGVECVVTPLTLFHFHQYALGGSLTTLLITPLISLMLVVSALICAVPNVALLRTMGVLHQTAMHVNDAASVAAGIFAAPPAMAIGIALAGALVMIASFQGRLRALAIITCMILPIAAAIVIANRDVVQPQLTVLDIGQGDAIVVRAPGHAVLVDGGPSGSLLLPLLADRGVGRLDAVVLTHVHPDHCGGLPAVITRLSVGQLWISPRRFRGECAQQLLESAAAARVPIHLVRDGDQLRVGGISFRAIVADQTFRRAAENNSSVVLQASIGKRTILLTGDIERDAEAFVATRARCADVLKVAHHGSRTSSTPLLLDTVAPRLALISCGRHNLFGHPHAEVLQAFRTRGVPVWRTDRSGTIEVDFEHDHIFVHRQIDTPR